MLLWYYQKLTVGRAGVALWVFQTVFIFVLHAVPLVLRDDVEVFFFLVEVGDVPCGIVCKVPGVIEAVAKLPELVHVQQVVVVVVVVVEQFEDMLNDLPLHVLVLPVCKLEYIYLNPFICIFVRN